MDNNSLLPNKKRLSFVLAIVSIAISISFIIANWLFTIPNGLVFLSVPFGVIALLFSLKTKKTSLIVLSIVVSYNFYLSMSLGYVVEAILGGDDRQKEIMSVYSPEQTVPITEDGDIYNVIERSNDYVNYVYFGRTDCTYCETFEAELSNVLGANYHFVYYYNTTEMPREEAEEVLGRYNIDRVPYLIKIDKGNVVESVTVADADKIIEFFTE